MTPFIAKRVSPLQALATALILGIGGCCRPSCPPKETFLITGTVTDSAGLPMEGVRLSLWMAGGSLPEAVAPTDAQGRYRFERAIHSWNQFDMSCETPVPLDVVGLEATPSQVPRSNNRQGIDLKYTLDNPGTLKVAAPTGSEGVEPDGAPFHSTLEICKQAPSAGPVHRIVVGRIVPSGPSGNRVFLARLAAGSYLLKLTRWKDANPAKGRGCFLGPVLEKAVEITPGAEFQWAPAWP